MNNSSLPTQRQLRVGEQVRQIISNYVLKNSIPSTVLIDISLTVSMVRMSKDLKIAYIYVMPLGGHNLKEVEEALNINKFIFQKELAKKIKTKFTPKIIFYIDNSFIEAKKINNLLSTAKVKKDIN